MAEPWHNMANMAEIDLFKLCPGQSAYLNGCSDFIDLWQTIQAFDGFTIPELGSDILVDLLRILMSGICQEMKKCDQPAW